MTMNGQKRSFQWAVTEKVAKAVIAGQATGTKTRQTKDHSPSPSTRAASNSSLEVLLKNCRNKNIPNTVIVNGAINTK